MRYMSHHLRTPLNIVSIGISLLVQDMEQRDCLPEESGEVKDIANTAESAIQTLETFLTYDKLEEGNLQLATEEVFVADLVSNTIQPFLILV